MKKSLIIAAALTASSMPVSAAVFTYSNNFTGGVGAEWAITADSNSADAGILGQLSSNGGYASALLGLSSAGASAANGGQLSFDLLGFRTIDGVNCCTDTFSLTINGTTVFSGAFNMGGGGSDAIFTDLNGASVTGSGQSRSISLAFTALAGANSFDFSYGPLQGFGDEAWGLDNVTLRAEVTPGAVPEPATWAMMLTGFGLVGAAARRRKVSLQTA